MVRSMTGYSSVRREEADLSLAVGVKSVNHRFLDLQFRLPSSLAPLESALRRTVKDHVARGHVEITVNLEKRAQGELKLDRKLLDAYINACRELRGELGSSAEPDPVALLRIPGVVASNGELLEDELTRIEQILRDLLGEALSALDRMRAREGAVLEQDIRGRIERLEILREGISGLADHIPEYVQQRLERRLQELPEGIQVDPARLAQEVAFLASRSDVSEELTRFKSHLIQARQLLNESSEVGKKMDFLLQELNREANTLLSKTADLPEVGAEVGRQAIEMKSEIEKLREQVQNIE